MIVIQTDERYCKEPDGNPFIFQYALFSVRKSRAVIWFLFACSRITGRTSNLEFNSVEMIGGGGDGSALSDCVPQPAHKVLLSWKNLFQKKVFLWDGHKWIHFHLIVFLRFFFFFFFFLTRRPTPQGKRWVYF